MYISVCACLAGRVNVGNDELDEMLKESSGPINFTVFLTMFGEKLKGKDQIHQNWNVNHANEVQIAAEPSRYLISESYSWASDAWILYAASSRNDLCMCYLTCIRV